jgi:hypothetical protein
MARIEAKLAELGLTLPQPLAANGSPTDAEHLRDTRRLHS